MIKERILRVTDEDTARSGYYKIEERDIIVAYLNYGKPLTEKRYFIDITNTWLPTGKWKCEKIVMGTGRDTVETEIEFSLEFMRKHEEKYPSTLKFKKSFPFFYIKEEETIVTYTKQWISENELIIETVETFEIQDCKENI